MFRKLVSHLFLPGMDSVSKGSPSRGQSENIFSCVLPFQQRFIFCCVLTFMCLRHFWQLSHASENKQAYRWHITGEVNMQLRLVPTWWISPCSRPVVLKTCRRSSVAESRLPYLKTFLAVLKQRGVAQVCPHRVRGSRHPRRNVRSQEEPL